MPELLLPEAKASGTVGTQGYMRFCPHCLAEWRDPWFRKIWRTSLASVCLGHGCYLLSRCSCGADVRPHLSKEVRSQAFCHACGNDLRSMKATPASDHDLARQREMNRRSYEGVEAILALGCRSRRRIVQLITRPTDHLCNLRKTGVMDAYAANSPITLLLAYYAARRRSRYPERTSSGARKGRHEA